MEMILNSILALAPVLLGVAFVVLTERKLLAAIQRRKGPNMVGLKGFLQSFVDGFKLILKENLLPHKSNQIMFFCSAFFIFVFSLSGWSMVPTAPQTENVDSDYTIFIVFVYSLINVYFIVLAGWSSNSKYSFLGAMRSTAQMISYEVYFGLTLIPIFMATGSTNLNDIIMAQKNCWYVVWFFPLFIVYFITTLAETNRSPFDLPESEAELVAGYNVEYAGLIFSFFFLAEYNNIFLTCAYTVVFFFGGYTFFDYSSSIIFFIKTGFLITLFVFIRGILPRYRYDQLMSIGWKKFLPLILGFVMFYAAIFIGGYISCLFILVFISIIILLAKYD